MSTTGNAKRPRGVQRSGFDWGGTGGKTIGSSFNGSGSGAFGSSFDGSGSGAIGSSVDGSGSGAIGARRRGLGYLPDLPDHRDYDLKARGVRHVIEKIKRQNGKRGRAAAQQKSFILAEPSALPGRHDLRRTGFFSPIEDQGAIGSCTAQAVIGMVEYLIRAGGGGTYDMSRMFLYKTTRRLLGWTGDTGAYLRSTIKALALFGVPPEEQWPYEAERLDVEPDAFLYSFAQSFKAVVYARLDPMDTDGETTLGNVKRALLDGFPAVFGMPVYASIDRVTRVSPTIPWPLSMDSQRGGHALLAVGYDDAYETNAGKPGALIVRNSWGAGWSDDGYAYLPYRYVEEQLAIDFWSVFNETWIHLDRFD